MTEESDAKHFSLMSVMWLIVFSQDYNISCKSPLLVVVFFTLVYGYITVIFILKQ